MCSEALPTCHCCGWPTNAANLDVLPDLLPGTWRIVERVSSFGTAHLRTHRRGFASEQAARAALGSVVGRG